MSQGIFRDAALERLSSPERLDELMRVTHPRAWISLAALASVLAAALFWGLAGSIPMKVSGSGIIVRPGGVFDVVSQGGGVVTEILVRSGDIIVVGQEVARVAQPLLVQQVAAARDLVSEMEKARRDIAASEAREAGLQNASLQQQIRTVNDQIAHTSASIAQLKEAVASAAEMASITENLNAQGLTNRQMVASAKSDLLAQRQQLAAAEERLTTSYNELQRIEIQRLTLARQSELQMQEIDEKLLNARANLAQLESQLRLTSTIASPYDGLVIDRLIDVGNIVRPGGGIISLELDFSRHRKGWKAVNEAVVFVPSADAKRIQRGMRAEIAPGDVTVEEYGFIVGHVRHVSSYAATTESMMRLLSNDSLVHSLESGGPVNEVIVDLTRTEKNPSGYIWSSKKSPNFRILSGTPCVGQVVTDHRRPVEMVIPYLRAKLGI